MTEGGVLRTYTSDLWILPTVYDSVSHEAVISVSEEAGLPTSFTKYIANVCNGSSTVLKVQGSLSVNLSAKKDIVSICEAFLYFPQDVGYKLVAERKTVQPRLSINTVKCVIL